MKKFSIQISIKFVRKDPNDNFVALVQQWLDIEYFVLLYSKDVVSTPSYQA